MKIFNRYIMKEVFPYTMMGFSIITFIILINHIVQLAGFLIRNSVSVWVLLRIIVNLLPAAAVFAIPMAVLAGIILGIGRLSADSEITAFRACGVSLKKFIKPILIFSLIALILDVFVSTIWLPRANDQLSKLYRKIIVSRTLTSKVKPRVFVEDLSNKVLYISRLKNRNRLWEDVIIFDISTSQEPNIILAQQAIPMDEDLDKGIKLRLRDAHIYNISRGDPIQHARISYTPDMITQLVEKEQFANVSMRSIKNDRSQTIPELIESIENTYIENIAKLSFRNRSEESMKIITEVTVLQKERDKVYSSTCVIAPKSISDCDLKYILPEKENFKGLKLKITLSKNGESEVLHEGTESPEEIANKFRHLNLNPGLLAKNPKYPLFSDAKGNKSVKIRKLHFKYPQFRRDYEHFQVEIHKKFSIPFVCIIFGLLALPLGISARRAGKSFGYLVSIAIFVSYWYLLLNGEILADTGKMSPFLGAWGADIVFTVVAVFFLLRMRKEKDFYIWENILNWLYRIKFTLIEFRQKLTGKLKEFFKSSALKHKKKEKKVSASKDTSDQSPGKLKLVLQVPRLYLRFPNTIDRYILSSYLKIFLLILLILYVISVVIQFTEISDDIYEKKASYSLLWDYYKYRFPDTMLLLIPISDLIATLTTFGIMSRNYETVAMKAAGVSQYRMSVPVVMVAILLSIVTFNISEKVLPYSKLKYDEVRREIKNLKPQTMQQMGKQFLFGKPRGENLNRIYYFYQYNEDKKSFNKISFYDYRTDSMRLVQRLTAESAEWNRSYEAWTFHNGWVQKYKYPGIITEEFENRIFKLDETPEYFKKTWETPDQMNYEELQELIVELKRKGFDPVYENVRLYWKLAYAIVTFVVVMIGIPFSFQMSNKGSLAGVFIALVIILVYYPMTNVFKHLGYSGVLPPLIAAWGGNVLFLLLSLIFMLRMKT